MEFFKAAARRSKRGYGDKLHRCNDAGEAARVLSRDLQNKMDKYYGAATLSDVNESSVLKISDFRHRFNTSIA